MLDNSNPKRENIVICVLQIIIIRTNAIIVTIGCIFKIIFHLNILYIMPYGYNFICRYILVKQTLPVWRNYILLWYGHYYSCHNSCYLIKIIYGYAQVLLWHWLENVWRDDRIKPPWTDDIRIKCYLCCKSLDYLKIEWPCLCTGKTWTTLIIASYELLVYGM